MKDNELYDTPEEVYSTIVGDVHAYAFDPEQSIGSVLMDPTPGPRGLEEATEAFFATEKGISIFDRAKEKKSQLLSFTSAHGRVLMVGGAAAAALVAGGIEVYKHLHSSQQKEK